MIETSELYKDYKEERKLKKSKNREQSLTLLSENFIPYKKFSDTHFRVNNYDFWPTTGVFINLETGKKGRGVFNLIKELKKLKLYR